jgi:hypothetical protein
LPANVHIVNSNFECFPFVSLCHKYWAGMSLKWYCLLEFL